MKKKLLLTLFHVPFLVAVEISDLTLEEKVGQVMMVCVQGDHADKTARTIIQDLHCGGVIYYAWANGLTSPDQVKKLSNELQTLAQHSRTHIPLCIAIDHEGGRVHWFKDRFTHFPSAFAYGIVNDSSLTKACAQAMGRELRAAGITMALAPVVDIMSNPHNPIIGIRSFGTKPETVIKHGHAFIDGLHAAGIATSIKHFPGHGDTATDSHKTLPVIHKTDRELELQELAPFAALAPLTDSVMTGHLLLPALDSVNCATLSKPIIDRLRSSFNGIVITDSLLMQGVATDDHDRSEAALKALNAGCDILLLGGRILVGATPREFSYNDYKNIHAHLVQAAHNGTLPLQRLDEAVQRILTFKKHYQGKSTHAAINQHQHKKLAQKLCRRAYKKLPLYKKDLLPTVYATLEKELIALQES